MNTNMTPPSPKSTGNRRSLLVFLLFPIFGIAAAVLLILGEQANRIPAAVDLPPTPQPAVIPTLVEVVDAPVIDFTAETLDGGTVTLSELNGRIVFLNFWATWCEPCKRELPAFEQFARDNPDPDDPLIIAVNYGETPEQIRDYFQAEGIGEDLFVALDPTNEIGDQYGIFQLPVTFVIDQQGIVRYPKYGEMTLDEMYGYVDALSTG